MTTQIRDVAAYAAVLPAATTKVRDLAVYAAVSPPAQVDIRSLAGYAMVEDPAVIDLRSFAGYAMVAAKPTVFFGLKGIAALLKAINYEQGLTLNETQVSFGDPTVETGYYDTGVVLTARSSWLYAGSKKLTYNRFTLADAFEGKSLLKPAGAFTSTHDWLPKINEVFGLQLEPRDIVLASVPANQPWMILRVAPTSYLYRPGSLVTFGDPANDFENLITVSDLNGFTPET